MDPLQKKKLGVPSASPYIALNVLSLKICCRNCGD